MIDVVVPPAPAATPGPSRATALTAAVLAGLALGAGSLALQVHLPYPWAALANSAAMWALAAFALGWWTRNLGPRAPVAGGLMMLIAVEAYYVAAIVALDDSVANLSSPATTIWLLFGLVTGPLFAAAGARAAADPSWWGALGAATGAGVCVAEALVDLRWGRDDVAAALIVLGALVIAIAPRGLRQRGRALVALVPIALTGWLAYTAARYGG